MVIHWTPSRHACDAVYEIIFLKILIAIHAGWMNPETWNIKCWQRLLPSVAMMSKIFLTTPQYPSLAWLNASWAMEIFIWLMEVHHGSCIWFWYFINLQWYIGVLLEIARTTVKPLVGSMSWDGQHGWDVSLYHVDGYQVHCVQWSLCSHCYDEAPVYQDQGHFSLVVNDLLKCFLLTSLVKLVSCLSQN